MQDAPIVFDASTLILLAKADLLGHAVRSSRIVVTDSVAREATRRRELADAQWIAKAIAGGEITVRRVRTDREVRRLEDDFGIALGEASSLALARRNRWLLGTDDGRTIKACKVLRVPFATAIHFLLEAYEDGQLSRSVALAKLEKLGRIGWYRAEIVGDARRRLQGGE